MGTFEPYEIGQEIIKPKRGSIIERALIVNDPGTDKESHNAYYTVLVKAKGKKERFMVEHKDVQIRRKSNDRRKK